jgi:hypothetical protein
MGTYTADPVALYKPSLLESESTWPALVNANMDAIASIFASKIQVKDGLIQTYRGIIQMKLISV